MRKLIGLLSLLFFIGLQVSYAQTRTISGIVTDICDKRNADRNGYGRERSLHN